jgi:hypothetical protein
MSRESTQIIRYYIIFEREGGVSKRGSGVPRGEESQSLGGLHQAPAWVYWVPDRGVYPRPPKKLSQVPLSLSPLPTPDPPWITCYKIKNRTAQENRESSKMCIKGDGKPSLVPLPEVEMLLRVQPSYRS